MKVCTKCGTKHNKKYCPNCHKKAVVDYEKRRNWRYKQLSDEEQLELLDAKRKEIMSKLREK
ncbi:MAG: hypothetical protein ACOC22_00475 [bacterium]